MPAGEDPPGTLGSIPGGGVAIVVGASGGIGAAALRALADTGRFSRVLGWSRGGDHPIDITREADVAAAAAAGDSADIRLVLVASGALTVQGVPPERSLGSLDPDAMLAALKVNTVGPALIAKHLLPRFPRSGKAVFAVLSARVGSIGDNHLGGWYSYRASKAALNQIIRTAAIELKRRAPDAVCLVLHPGTVETPLSRPFARVGLEVQAPDVAAARLVRVIDATSAAQSGCFLDQHGDVVPW